MSDSVMMPVSLPSCTTGRLPIFFATMMRAASSSGVSSATVITSRFMMLRTVILDSR